MAAAEMALSPRALLKLAGGPARAEAPAQERQAWALALGRVGSPYLVKPEMVELELIALSGSDRGHRGD